MKTDYVVTTSSRDQTESDPQGLCSLCSDYCCQLLVIAQIDSNQLGYSRICWRLNYSEVDEQTGSVFTPFGLASRSGCHLHPSADPSRLSYSCCSNQYQLILIFQQIYYIYIQYNIYIYTVCIYIYMYAAKYVYIHISISINCKSTAVVLPGLNDDHFIP